MPERWGMTNLSFQFKSKSYLLNIAIIIAVLGYAFLTYGFDIILLVSGIALVFLTLINEKNLRDHITRHKKVNTLAKNLAKGNLNYRITNVSGDDLSQETINQLNTAADQIEILMREVKTCFTFAQQHIYDAQ